MKEPTMKGRHPVASRRQVLLGAGALAGVGMIQSVVHSVLAATANSEELAKAMAGIKLTAVPPKIAQYITTNDGVSGPWGEVRVGRAGGVALPVLIQSADKLGIISLAQKQPAVTIGVDRADGITLTSEGVAFGKGAKPEPWSAALVSKLVKTLASDRQKTRALMQLRAAFMSAYPVYLAATKSTTDKRVAALYDKSSRSSMSNAGCTTSTVTDTVEHVVTEAVEQWKSAEKQYQECFDHETSGAAGLACSLAPAGLARDACAATVCSAKGFVDVLLAVYTVTHTVTEQVVRTVVTCATALKGAYKNAWNIIDRSLPGLEKPGATPAKISEKDVSAALDLLKAATGPFGAFATCLINGKWSLESIEAPLVMVDGNVAIPYGVRVCIGADCAHKLTIQGAGSELAAAWPAAVTLLGALSPDFIAFAASVGIPVTVPGAVAAAVAALPPAAVIAASLILAVIILALIYGTAIAGQLTVAEALGAFSDGEVCIVHPTIALAMIKALMLGNAPTELVPPIVVG
jgi:hypothetical protein